MNIKLIALFFIVATIATAKAQKIAAKDKLTLTINRNGITKTEEIYAMSFDFNKLNRSVSLRNNGAAVINIACSRHLTPFMVKAASGDSSNIMNATIKYYGKTGKLYKTIVLRKALVTDIEDGFGGDYAGSANRASITIMTNNMSIDGSKM